MFERFDDAARRVVVLADQEARRLHPTSVPSISCSAFCVRAMRFPRRLWIEWACRWTKRVAASRT